MTTLPRRKFLKNTAIGALAISGLSGASYTLINEIEKSETEETLKTSSLTEDFVLRKAQSEFRAAPEDIPALVRKIPELNFNDPRVCLKIVNSLEPNFGDPRQFAYGSGVGHKCFFLPQRPDTPVIPWAPFFSREESHVHSFSARLKANLKCSDLYFKEEGSKSHPIYGNKARKYEFLLPNLSWYGTTEITTSGALGSNHALQLALANKMAAVAPGNKTLNIKLNLLLYPQDLTPSIKAKLKIMKALANRVSILNGDFEVAMYLAKSFIAEDLYDGTKYHYAFVGPGGSNELSTLGHFNAILELAEAMESGKSEMLKPPDEIYVALGSGATTLGLLMGIYFLKWPTKIIAVASQDKGLLARKFTNGRTDLSFALGNLIQLEKLTLDWLRLVSFPFKFENFPTFREERLLVDAQAWKPAYGVLSREARALVKEAESESMILDNTFTGKAYSVLAQQGSQGKLEGKRVLFWNTFNGYTYEILAL